MADGVDVLPGPRAPFWPCSRGLSSNWVSRLVRRCGKPAPAAVAKTARGNAKRAQRPAGGQQPRQILGARTGSIIGEALQAACRTPEEV
eukprot:757459-Pyramimonas_sp.AAC.1